MPIGKQRVLFRWLFVLLTAALTAFRVWYGGSHGLVYDEAYYWTWARHLATGYYDQGPGVALAIRFGLLFGHSTAAVRTMAFMDAAIASWMAYLIASRVFHDERAGFWAGTLLNLVPLLFAGGILMTHDSPQMATWTLAMYALARSTGVGDTHERSSRTALYWWIAAGLLAGLSVDCKYTAVLFFPCVLLYLWVSDQRWMLRTPAPWIASLLGLAMVAPPIFWNLGHDWASARHILNLGGVHNKSLIDTGSVGDYLAGQILVTLLFFFTMAWAAITAGKQGRRQNDRGLLLLACFSWPIWAFFLLLSLHGKVEPNWPVPAYFAAATATPWLVAEGFRKATTRKQRWLIFYHTISIILAVFGIALLLFPQVLGVLPGGKKILAGYESKDRTNEMYGWNSLAKAVCAAGAGPGGNLLPATARYQDASELSFWLPGQPYVYNLPVQRRRNQYDYWPPLQNGANALVVILEKDAPVVQPQLSKLFATVGSPTSIPVWRRSLYAEPINRYLLIPCRGYRGGRDGLLTGEW